MRKLRRLKRAWKDFWQLTVPPYVCKVLGHKEPYQRKFGGELLCFRCARQVGRWSL